MMERQEIVKLFMREGIQLDLQSLEFLETKPEMVKSVIGKIKKQPNKPSILTLDFIQPPNHSAEIEVLKYYKPNKTTLTVSDYAKILTNRFEKIKKILGNRIELENLISLNRTTQHTKKFSVICSIEDKDYDKKTAVISDHTGELYVYFENDEMFNQLVPDEIIGLVCEQKEKRFVVENIVWPEIPIKKEINRTVNDIHCIFVSDFHMNEIGFRKESYEKFLSWINTLTQDNLYIFVLGDVSENKEQTIDFFRNIPPNIKKIFVLGNKDQQISDAELKNVILNPSLVKIETVTIFLNHAEFFNIYKKQWPNLSTENILQSLFRKRHMNPTIENTNSFLDDENFILDTVPDVMAFGHTHIPSSSNYKGTTIITTGSFLDQPIFWMINLKTREVNKLDFT